MNCITCNNILIGSQKKFCSSKCKNKAHQSYDQQQERGHLRKIELLNLLGNKCSICSYNKNLAALCFHHLKDKQFKLDMRSLSNRTWESCLAEAQKCQLLCANCHAEIHNPDLALTN